MSMKYLQPLTNVPTKSQPSTPYIIQELGQDFKTHGEYNKVKGQIKITPLCCTPTPPTNVSTNYQLATPYGFRDRTRTRFYRSKSLWQGQIKVTPIPPNNVLASINFLHLTVSEIAWTRFYRSMSLQQGQRSIKVTP